MHPNNKMRLAAQRLVAACLFVLFGAFYAAPSALALLRHQQPAMDCCPTDGHGCCRRASKHTDQSGPAWAGMNCASRCGSVAAVTFHSHLFVNGQQASSGEVTARPELIAAQHTGFTSSFYLAFLYQRPPPLS